MDENTVMTKEEEGELQSRLKAASKNAQVFQNKVRDLNVMVDNVMKRKEFAEEELVRKKAQLKEVSEKLNKIQTRYNEADDRLQGNRRKAKALRDLIKKSEAEFSSQIKRTRSLNALAGYHGKEVETNLVALDLQADRGYSCKKGSTFGHLASISAKSFF